MKNREDLKKKLDEKINKIKGLFFDSYFGNKLLNEILSIKSQLDIEPTIVHIPVSSIDKKENGENKVYDFGHFNWIKTKSEIIVSILGYKQIIKPYTNTLYGQMLYLMTMIDKKDELSEEEVNNLDLLVNATMTILLAPSTCFSKDSYWIDLATYITKLQNDMYEELMETPLSEEDEEANEKFRQEIEMAEDIKKFLNENKDN